MYGLYGSLGEKAPDKGYSSDILELPMVGSQSLLPVSSVYLPKIQVLGIISSNSLKQKALALNKKHGGQCVFFVQQFLEIFQNCDVVDCTKHPFRGYAGYIQPNSDTPGIGKAVLFSGNPGHTAVIIDIVGDELELAESNYNYDEIIKVGRKIKVTDKNIRGYFDL